MTNVEVGRHLIWDETKQEYTDWQPTESNVSETTVNDGGDTMRIIENITGAFNHARDAIISASQLAKDVAALRAEVEQIKQDLVTEREKNAQLDAQIVSLRQQRDEAYSETSSWRNQFRELDRQHALLQSTHSGLENDHLKLMQDHENLRTNFNNEVAESARLREELANLRKAHNEVKSRVEAINAIFGPKTVEVPVVQSSATELPEAPPLPFAAASREPSSW